jgi:hypothetical protein
MGLTGMLRAVLRSVLPVRRSACDMVSMFSSPLFPTPRLWWVEVGLPRGFRLGDMSSPLIEPDLLVGGDVSGWDDMGDRIGDGERLRPLEESDVRPTR